MKLMAKWPIHGPFATIGDFRYSMSPLQCKVTRMGSKEKSRSCGRWIIGICVLAFDWLSESEEGLDIDMLGQRIRDCIIRYISSPTA